MNEKIQSILVLAREEISKVVSEKELADVEVKYLGRKSEMSLLLRDLKNLSVDERKVVGPMANEAKQTISQLISAKRDELERDSFDADSERIDVTLPGTKREPGHMHPITIVRQDIEKIFTSMGFEVADGPEVETEWRNFDALNIPKDHPARDMQDTFWLNSEEKKDRLLLRTHTSNVQIRFMEKHKPPFRIIAPGRIYRNEATDVTHEHTFHQFEALVVGDDINVGNFKYIAETFFSQFFGTKVTVRLRPSFFPFTEPSFEFDISCTVCGGKKCSACKHTGWLEVGGAGMVNQAVFEAAGYERGKYQGFAWGFGLERLAMMKYKITDIRNFHSGDLRFVKQF